MNLGRYLEQVSGQLAERPRVDQISLGAPRSASTASRIQSPLRCHQGPGGPPSVTSLVSEARAPEAGGLGAGSAFPSVT